MEDPSKLTSPKLSKIAPSSNTKRGIKSGQAQPFRLQTEQRGQMKEQAFAKRVQELVAEEAKLRIPVAQGLPLTTDKPQNLPKPTVKEQTKPLNIKLHTEQRAARRAGFNNLVSSKNYSLEILRRFEEKLLKVMEEEEIRIMRREMVPKAQLMPIFDRPFLPQRKEDDDTRHDHERRLHRNKCQYMNMQNFLLGEEHAEQISELKKRLHTSIQKKATSELTPALRATT